MFEDITYESLLDDVLSRAPAGIDTRQGSIFYDAVSGILIKVAKLYSDLDLIAELTKITTTSGEALDVRAGEYGIIRLPATTAKYKVSFQGVTPRQGERFFIDGHYFNLKEDQETHELYIESEEPGEGLNGYVSGTHIIPVNNIEGLTAAAITDIYERGVNQEADEDLRKRLQQSIAGPSENGNKQHYKTWCESIPGVGRARIFPLWNGPNTVKAVLIDGIGAPCSLSKVSEVQKYIDPANKGLTANVNGRVYTIGDGLGEGVANLGAHFTAAAALPLNIRVSFAAELAGGKTKDAVQQEAQAAIADHFRKLALYSEAGDIVVRISAVGAILSDLSCIQDYSQLTLNGVSENITTGEDYVPICFSVEVI